MRTDVRRDDEHPGPPQPARAHLLSQRPEPPDDEPPDDELLEPEALEAIDPPRGTSVADDDAGGWIEAPDEEGPGAAGRADQAPAPARQGIRRSHVYTQPVVDGRVVRDNIWTRVRATVRSLLTSNAEREEAEIEHALRTHAGATRTNTIAQVSPKGGVGKTSLTFVIGNLLASHLKLRALAIDMNPDHGTLASLAPDHCRVERSLWDLLCDLERVHSAPELSPYIARLPSGLHILASPTNPELMKRVTPERYGDLLAFLGRYYDAVLLDLGTGITEDLPQFAIERADQVVVVSEPKFVTVEKVLGALDYLRGDQGRERLTLALNMVPSKGAGDRRTIEAAFAQQQVRSRVTMPFDERLETMLDSGTYSLEGLDRRTRMAIKRLGFAVARQLV